MGEPIQPDRFLMVLTGNFIVASVITLMIMIYWHPLSQSLRNILDDFYNEVDWLLHLHIDIQICMDFIAIFTVLGCVLMMPTNRILTLYRNYLYPYFPHLYWKLRDINDAEQLKMKIALAGGLLAIIASCTRVVHYLACKCIQPPQRRRQRRYHFATNWGQIFENARPRPF